MVIHLSITGDRDAVHATLLELVAITQATSVQLKRDEGAAVVAVPNPIDTAIRTAAKRNGQWRVR